MTASDPCRNTMMSGTPLFRRFITTLALFMAAAPVQVHGSNDADIALGRGKRWVRNNPFTTTALTLVPSVFDANDYNSANLNTVLAWKIKTKILEGTAAKGLPWHLHIYPHKQGLTDKLKGSLTKIHKTYPGQTGWLVWDEVQYQDMETAATTIRWLKEQFPDTLVYSNALPFGAPSPRKYWGWRSGPEDKPVPEEGYPYEQYMRDFATILDTDIVMFDAYPFHENGNTSNLLPTMNAARTVSLEQGVPYWAFVQSHSDTGRGYRTPSESDIRMQVFMHLAYGFTGIAYFTYGDLGNGESMVSETQKRYPLYYTITRLNQEVIHVGQALRFLNNTDVRYLPANGNPLPLGATAWQPGAGGNQIIRAITVEDTERADWKDLMIGFFTDDHQRQYVMVTNLWHDKGASAIERALTVTLDLDPTIKVTGRLSRETGHPEALRVSGGKLQLTLPGGTGELLRFGDTKFPGLESD